MLLFDISNTCSDVGLANILNIVKQCVNLIWLIGPIISLVMIGIHFLRLMMNPDDKKLSKKLKNSVVSLMVLFFIPGFVNVTMYLLSDSNDFSKCWNNVEKVNINFGKSTYIKLSDKKKYNTIIDPSEYENGDAKHESSTSNNSNTGTSNSTNSSANSSTNSSTGSGGAATSISIKYNVKDKKGRCGTGSGDYCIEKATVTYPSRKVTYYMGYQNNSGLLSGSCRSHAFTCGMNAVEDSYYSTLDIQKYLNSSTGNGVLKGKGRFNDTIKHFGVNAKAYFNETSISESINLAKKALDNGQPVIIFVANNKCSDLASSHHAILLLGYDNTGNVIFLDSCGRYPSAKKRNLNELGKCMSDDGIARDWMRMVIFSF